MTELLKFVAAHILTESRTMLYKHKTYRDETGVRGVAVGSISDGVTGIFH
jgi:hypothetical protein